MPSSGSKLLTAVGKRLAISMKSTGMMLLGSAGKAESMLCRQASDGLMA
jgi:hypothetical protein